MVSSINLCIFHSAYFNLIISIKFWYVMLTDLYWVTSCFSLNLKILWNALCIVCIFTHPNIEQNEDNTKSTKISNNNLNNADNHVHNINNKQTCASPCFDLYQQTWSLPSRFYSLHIHFIHPKILKLNRIINSVLQIISKNSSV